MVRGGRHVTWGSERKWPIPTKGTKTATRLKRRENLSHCVSFCVRSCFPSHQLLSLTVLWLFKSWINDKDQYMAFFSQWLLSKRASIVIRNADRTTLLLILTYFGLAKSRKFMGRFRDQILIDYFFTLST